jgi:1-acyl-sn-glycerol-3-phosphate acyltransferase
MQRPFNFVGIARRGIDYLLSPLYLLYFCVVLLGFHVIQVVTFWLGGRTWQQHMAALMNAFLVRGQLLTGSTTRFRFATTLPTDRPLIFVANHQSLFDIPPMGWFLRTYNPVFVAKKELEYGTPSVSYNLRKSGAALIDRTDARQSLSELGRLGGRLKARECSVIIFPEGTRSRDGMPRPFAGAGLAILLKKAPAALIVPIAISGTGTFNPQGLFPFRAFTRMTWTVLPPLDPTGLTADAVAEQARQAIIKVVGEC